MAILATLLVLPGCRHMVRDQRLGDHVLASSVADFEPDHPSDAVLHYYGVGGWGILWKGQYLLTAPYFSNHDLLASSICEAKPDEHAISRGFANTPYDRTKVILVGHGHVDHAADIPKYPLDEMDDPTLVADQSTVNLLGDEVLAHVCEVALPREDGTDASPHDDVSSALPTDGDCPTGDFRITPLPWAHAPHVGLRSLGLYGTFGAPQGTQGTALHEPPSKGNDWLIGRTWAFLIELLDAGRPVFRILYVDAAASPGFVGPWPAIDDGPIDVHIACMPDFDLVDGYPGDLLKEHHVKYVLAGHWEDFFRSRDRSVRPVGVLSEKDMNAFVLQVEQAIGWQSPAAGPDNKDSCKVGETCGPHAPTWSVPIPGETFWFHTASPASAPGSSGDRNQ